MAFHHTLDRPKAERLVSTHAKTFQRDAGGARARRSSRGRRARPLCFCISKRNARAMGPTHTTPSPAMYVENRTRLVRRSLSRRDLSERDVAFLSDSVRATLRTVVSIESRGPHFVRSNTHTHTFWSCIFDRVVTLLEIQQSFFDGLSARRETGRRLGRAAESDARNQKKKNS